jgi:hypothetical protein
MMPFSPGGTHILTPEALLDLASESHPPVDLLNVALAAGLKVEFDARLPATVRGNLLRDCGVIVVNPRCTSPQRLRMTIAHEIAEAVLFRNGRPLCFLDPPHFCPTSLANGQRPCPHHERLCNWYGARLIAPSSWLYRESVTRPMNVHNLARRYFCSLTLARLRVLEEARDRPAATATRGHLSGHWRTTKRTGCGGHCADAAPQPASSQAGETPASPACSLCPFCHGPRRSDPARHERGRPPTQTPDHLLPVASCLLPTVPKSVGCCSQSALYTR